MTREEAIDVIMTKGEAINVIKKPRTVRYKLHNPIEYVSIEFDEEEEVLSANYTTEKPNDEVEQNNDVVAEPTDLISRAEAIEEVCGVVMEEFDVPPTLGYEVAEKSLSALPSADRPTDDDDIKDRQIKQLAHDVVILEKQLADRPSGEWTDMCVCSICGFKPWYEGDIHTLNYCPNCGAKMGINGVKTK